MTTKLITPIVVLVLLSLGLSAQANSPGSRADSSGQWSFQTELRVMTLNLYAGANFNRLLAARGPEEVPVLVAEIYQEIRETNFTMRAQALAEAIERGDPDLIGLQEVSLIRRQRPGDFLIGNPTAAADVELDYLQILIDALEARGLEYGVVAISHESDIELPMLVGGSAESPELDDARLTLRDVILKRVGVETRDVQVGNFTNNLVFALAGVQVELTRGYASVVAKIHGREYKFVNVHLETAGNFFSRAMQSLQASELVELLGAEGELPIVLVGDINSPPESGQTSPYHKLAAAGFVDTWTQRSYAFSDRQGHTCCQSEGLTNGESLLAERIDQIWVRLPGGGSRTDSSGQIGYTRVSLLGDSPEDMIEGLWPSDHAGVLARLRIPGR
ncbi:MAG: endonuclease/exonuclease/phosphatase family protein [Truepera sp.]|nr:endonuclease/exonuclease/phosphatase family protein [Truepera sp.]